MPISFTCPACGHLLEAPDAAAGSTGNCKYCHVRIIAPSANGGTAILPPANASSPPQTPAPPPPAPITPAASQILIPPPPPAGEQYTSQPSGPRIRAPKPAANTWGKPNWVFICLMWSLTVLFWGSRFLTHDFSMLLWLGNGCALLIAVVLRQSESHVDQLNGNVRWGFGLVMVLLSMAFRWGFGM